MTSFWKNAGFVMFRIMLAMTVIGVFAVASCRQQSSSGDVQICLGGTCSTFDKKNPTRLQKSDNTVPKPADNKTAFLMLRENCSGCHGTGRDKRSYWPMPTEFDLPLDAEARAAGADMTKTETFEQFLEKEENTNKLVSKMEADQFSVQVFQAIENKLTGTEKAIPLGMPPSMEQLTRDRFVALMDKLLGAKNEANNFADSDGKKILSLAEAGSWCSGCHTAGGSGAKVWSKANGDENDWKQIAQMAKDSVVNGRMPPPRPEGEKRNQWLSVASWFQAKMPLVVEEARAKYHGQKLEIGTPVEYNFSCSSPTTARQFLNRITSDALGRSATGAEISLIDKPDSPVTPEQRKMLVERLSKEWKTEFLNYGFKIFAEKITNANRIRNSLIISDSEMRDDIAGEFFELLRTESEAGKSYKDILLSNKVYVTKNTAKFYNKTCESAVANSGSEKKYTACEMNADNSPRSNFFTTLGFLASKSSSMFSENNNYGRVAALNEVIRGEPLLANTQGEEGNVDPLPACLVTSDWRVIESDGKYAPRGTATIPASGNFCQGCHIRRNLAAGGIAFRPFGPMGELLSGDVLSDLDARKSNLNAQETILYNQISAALSPEWGMLRPDTSFTQLTLSTFKNFLNVGLGQYQERGCIVDPLLPEPKTVTRVADLVDYAMSDDLALARGLSRIVPRALSNLNSTNSEIIKAINKAWTDSNGQLIDVFQAYFLTDTYACSSTGGGK